MSAQQILLSKYGQPDHNYLMKYCELWHVQDDFKWFPAHSFLVNKDFKAMLVKAFTALQAKGLHTEIKTYDGCYNDRSVRGANSKSLHAWASAIDLNASKNGMVANPKPNQRNGNWSQGFIDTMKAAGIFFGGDFISRADPMHFAQYDG